MQAFSSCGKRERLSSGGARASHCGASLLWSAGSRGTGFSGCGAQDPWLWCVGSATGAWDQWLWRRALVAPWCVGSVTGAWDPWLWCVGSVAVVRGLSCSMVRGISSWRMGSVAVARGLSCSVAHAIFLDLGLNPRHLHWQVGSFPLSHKGRLITSI